MFAGEEVSRCDDREIVPIYQSFLMQENRSQEMDREKFSTLFFQVLQWHLPSQICPNRLLRLPQLHPEHLQPSCLFLPLTFEADPSGRRFQQLNR